MRVSFKTFGCKANSTDTDVLFLEAKKRGYDVLEGSDKADAFIINTCTVTESADKDARVYATKLKRNNPDAFIAMIGCYAQVAKDELLALPSVDYVLGTANKLRVLDQLNPETRSPEKDFVEKTAGFLPVEFLGSRHARATIKIQDGCNYKCSFCIIPEARGRSRSLPLSTVLKQITDAEAAGFNEIILTGIHLAHYGWDQGTDLSTLLKEIFKNTSGPRVRLSTLDPFEIPESLLDLLKNEERLCPHFHIALQSGSDLILSRMKRLYKAKEFVDICGTLNETRPHTFIGVDVIVGFNGETEKEFQETVKCLEDSYWTKLHVFPFSMRRGTAAEKLDGVIDTKTIHSRSAYLRKISETRYQEFLNSQLGLTKEIILERPHDKNPNIWLGHTENYIPTLSELKDGVAKSKRKALLTKIQAEKIWTA